MLQTNEKIPHLRSDIQLQPYTEDGNEFLILSDKFGYTSAVVMISAQLFEILYYMPLDISYSNLGRYLNTENQELINLVIENINFLSEQGFLETKEFSAEREKSQKEYLDLKVRPYICSLSSYPDDKDELNKYLAKLFSSTELSQYRSNASAIIAPHIDLRLSKESHHIYSPAFHSAYDSDFDLIVMFGTAHYASSDYFMLTNKNYSTPLGVIETDLELQELWNIESGNILHYDEFAHKPEHSLEYHILLSQYYFKDREFTVLPILVGSFYDFIIGRKYPDKNNKFNKLINSLKNTIEKSGKKPLYMSSVDFSHIGRKFDDNFDAEPELSRIKSEDNLLIDAIERADYNQFMKYIIENQDKNKICGTAPIYSMLYLNKFKSGKLLNYGQWNEIETKSAVSFSSIALY